MSLIETMDRRQMLGEYAVLGRPVLTGGWKLALMGESQAALEGLEFARSVVGAELWSLGAWSREGADQNEEIRSIH